MSKEINLLRKTKKQNLFLENLLIFKIISYFIFGVSLILTFLFFYLSKTQNNDSLLAQDGNLRNKLAGQNNKIAKFLFVKDRLFKINQILNKRNNFNLDIDEIEKGLPASVAVNSLSVDSKIISVSFSSSSLADINQFSNFLGTLSGKNSIFKQITIDSVLLDSTNNKYSLSITGNFL